MKIHTIPDKIDLQFIIDTLVALAQVPTDVPMGTDVFMAPDDPKLVHYVQHVLRPMFVGVGAYDLIDAPGNQFIARYGEGRIDRSMLIQVYTPAQHHNLMDDPWSGKVARGTQWGYDEPCVFGQGVTQTKSHQAIALGILKLLHDNAVPIAGTLYIAVNNEGRSSHACTRAILETLDIKPDFALLMIATNEMISIGNRGRVDVNVTVRGKAVHSSMPDKGLSAIEGAYQVMTKLKQMTLPGRHPKLGGRHAIPYQISYEPLAPHTLPHTARLRIDRRLLPGDELATAVDEVRSAIGDLSPYVVTAEQGEHMWPSLVDPEHAGVRALGAAHESVHGKPPGTFYGQGTFDAGGTHSAGIPTVMYGVGGGADVLEEDFVPLTHLDRVSRVVARTIFEFLGE